MVIHERTSAPFDAGAVIAELADHTSDLFSLDLDGVPITEGYPVVPDILTDEALAEASIILPDLTNSLIAAEQGNNFDFFTREALLRNEQLPAAVLQYMFGWLKDHDQPFIVRTSTTSLRDPDAKREFLLREAGSVAEAFGEDPSIIGVPVPLRTVTLTFSGTPHPEFPTVSSKKKVLVSGVSDGQLVTDPIKFAIAESLEVSRKKAKGAKINDRDVNPGTLLGMASGVVSPFVLPELSGRFSKICYVPGDLSNTTPVDIAVSPLESLFVKKGPFEQMLRDYATNRLPQGKLSYISPTAK